MFDPSGGSVSSYDCPHILLADQQSCTCHLVAETGTRQTNVSMHLRGWIGRLWEGRPQPL